VSRQRQRPAVGGGNAEVVSIGLGVNREPDWLSIACGHVAAARLALDLSRAEFAEYIRERTKWDVIPETITAWETDEDPPGDLVVFCQAMTQSLPATSARLLDGVPPAFPAEVLAGTWVTSYQFMHAGQPHYHADIAHVVVGPGNRIRAANHPPEPRSEGRGRAFRNEIEAELRHRHLVGVWMNTSDTRYFGSLTLAVLQGETVMEGMYSGVASDVEVSGSLWRWVRLDTGPIPAAGFTLRDPHELHDLVMAHSEYGAPLTLADVRGDD